ncbi:probable 28S ribosomal protein S23, mitochondrial [Coccinella septempunctata]|uniref:probable 28S ribosomal protein S23, mitochondrial n=1 Tax=Coccinella septempunctata TaxID=41139 RepID=UPI001D06164C|nr:probable 28S ribosomal protein S23, mitochondrial [Coccinella septempunctata]
MAGSRLEKIGTIHSRALGLIETGAKRWEDRPLWFDIYEAFPPKDEPTFSRPAPNLKLRQIFYQEDKIRAQFHKRNKYLGVTNLSNSNAKTLTQKFIENYRKIEEKYDSTQDQETIYSEAIELLKREKEVQQNIDIISSNISIDKNTKESSAKVNLNDIFK